MVLMAKRKGDRHQKRSTQFRMRELHDRALRALCERNDTTRTEEIHTAIRERAERAGLWPPPPENTK